jgi:hypothetical protein
MASLIPRLKKGGTPSFLNTDLGNKVIDAINALAMLKVSPSGYGKFEMDGKSGATLDLGALQKIIQDLSSKVQAIETSLSQSGTQVVNQRLDSVIAALNNATVTAACEAGSGAITVTITFPDVPPPSGS